MVGVMPFHFLKVMSSKIVGGIDKKYLYNASAHLKRKQALRERNLSAIKCVKANARKR
jgi:hypothetical protein